VVCKFHNTLQGCVRTPCHLKHICSICGSNKHGATACGKKNSGLRTIYLRKALIDYALESARYKRNSYLRTNPDD
jgi:hypothetical protein